MRILVVGKYPPVQGGTSSQVMNTVRHLAGAGHTVHVVTNGREAEASCRAILTEDDERRFESLHRIAGAGSVTVHQTTPVASNSYIPWARPFGSELFGVGVDLALRHDFDLIVGWYFEPYGLVAGHIAEAAGRPLLLRHAGSDLGRLAQHRDLGKAYRWLLRRADVVLTGPRSHDALIGLGAAPDSLRDVGPGLLADYFDGPCDPFDVADVAGKATVAFESMDLSGPVLAMLLEGLHGATAVDGPVIGICGKVARTKGSYDLVSALERLAADGRSFTLLGAIGGQESLLVPFLEEVARTEHLRRRCVLLPFLAPWRMPGFYDACDAVCLLERRFDVALHRTRVPEEVMRRGRALVLSEEMSHNVYFSRLLRDRRNHLQVRDPADIEALASTLDEVISNPDLRQVVAAGGREVAERLAARVVNDGPAVGIGDAMASLAQ